MDLAVLGDRLVTAIADGTRVRVDVEGDPVPKFTDSLHDALMPPAVAVSPTGEIAIAARTNETKQIFGCLLGKPWVYLGPSNTRQGVAWKGGQFVWARVHWTVGRLYEQTIEYDADGTGREVDLHDEPMAVGIHYYDEIDGRWLHVAQRETAVGPFRMLRPVRRRLPSGQVVYCGQVVGTPDYQAIATDDGAIAFRAAAQVEIPTFLVLGDRLVCLDRAGAVRSFRPPYPTLEAPPVSIPAIGRPFWLGWYQFGVSPVPPPGNCQIRVVQGADKFITTADGRVIAAYAEGLPEDGGDSSLAAVEKAVARLASRYSAIPVAAYWTRQAQARQERLPVGAAIIVAECYRQAGESLAAYEARGMAAVTRCPRAWMAVNCYTSNPNNHPDVASVVAVAARIARANLNVEGAAAFSAGEGRDTGWEDHPEAQDEWRAFYAGITATPVLAPPLRKPGVTILDWQPIDADKSGLLVKFTDRNNPAHGTTTVSLDGGYIRVEIENAVDRDKSGKQDRKVI